MIAVRLAALALAVASLLTGVAGGLLRLGWALPVGAAAAAGHAPFLIAGFLGTVIALERAIALGGRWAFLAPAAGALGALAQIAGLGSLAVFCWLTASALLFAVSAAIVRRQSAPHTWLLLLATIAWFAGCARLALRGLDDTTIVAWFLFLVLTIAAERLELTRLMKRRPAALPLLGGVVAALAASATAVPFAAAVGLAGFGAALVALALWLATFDLARRTIAMPGFARYAAVALLGGYAWLALGGIAWIAYGIGHPLARDAALHALGLGFVVTMIFAHAPIVVPVIARVRLRFTHAFYVPLALLHASLAIRLLPFVADPDWRRIGGLLNAAALAVFVVTLLASIGLGRRKA